MKKFLSIAWLNFKEATRDKFFFGVVFFFIFYLAFCLFLGKLSVGHGDKVLRNAGLVGIELTALILIMFSFIFSFFRERESRILEVYLCNFSRQTCLAGKIFGYILLALLYIFLSGLGLGLLLYFYQAFNPAVLPALYPIFLKAVLIIGFSSIFASLFSSATMALLSSLFLYLACEAIPTALAIAQSYGSSLQKRLVEALYFFLPNMDKLDLKVLAVYGKPPSLTYLGLITVYVSVYALFLWLINLFIFRRKEY